VSDPLEEAVLKLQRGFRNNSMVVLTGREVAAVVKELRGLVFGCSYCGAEPGHYCQTRTGHRVQQGHTDRLEAWRAYEGVGW
jgi:hypothetical protein